MTPANPVPSPFEDLVCRVAARLGVTPQVAVGTPVVIALRCEQRPSGTFLSGVPADAVGLMAGRFGASVGAAQISTAEAGNDAIPVAIELWHDGVGTGPVSGGIECVRITAGHVEQPDKLEEATRLRSDLRRSAARLTDDMATAPISLDAVISTSPSPALTAVLRDVAHSRRLNGRYLLDAADWFDDERIDQLGDGYLRAAALWDTLAVTRDPAALNEVLDLERTCLRWMESAAEQPTRYAF